MDFEASMDNKQLYLSRQIGSYVYTWRLGNLPTRFLEYIRSPQNNALKRRLPEWEKIVLDLNNATVCSSDVFSSSPKQCRRQSFSQNGLKNVGRVASVSRQGVHISRRFQVRSVKLELSLVFILTTYSVV